MTYREQSKDVTRTVGKLGIIAGDGPLPVLLASVCAATSSPFFVIRLDGITAPDDAFGADEICGLGEAGKMIRLLKENRCDRVVMAGLVSRPDFRSLKLDMKGTLLLPRVIKAAATGDGALLDVLVAVLEEEGMEVIGADEVASDLSFPKGVLTAASPSTEALQDIAKAARLIAALDPFDVGQGCVVANGLVMAVEAAEGTDAMLSRCAELPRSIFGAAAEHTGVLVKCPKPSQELRVDLPTVGVETLKGAKAAGLSGVAVAAGRALLMDRQAAIAYADEHGLFLFGFKETDLQLSEDH
ncbi:MAG: UDP-2,3-diacylglucosamine diphosphatase LpxI [Pseudomonadota bacterium]